MKMRIPPQVSPARGLLAFWLFLAAALVLCQIAPRLHDTPFISGFVIVPSFLLHLTAARTLRWMTWSQRLFWALIACFLFACSLGFVWSLL